MKFRFCEAGLFRVVLICVIFKYRDYRVDRQLHMTKIKPIFRRLDNVSLKKIHLDPLNPRHDPLDDENEIIAQLYKQEYILALAKDIVAKGTLNPLDSTGVIEMDDNPGHYIVVEGNRRACALKLLHEPHKAPDKDAQAAFELLAQRFEVPTLLSVIVFTDRITARPWIGLRHLGAQDGAGTREWNSSQKARYAETESPDQLALAVLDRAEGAGWIDAGQRKQLAITTLTRYLSNPLVRAALGLGSNRELQYTHEVSEVDAALCQFLADAVPSIDGTKPLVHSRSKKLERESYARELSTRGVSPRTLLKSPTPPPDTKKPSLPIKSRSKPHPDNRKYLMPTDFVIHHRDKSLLRLRQELRSSPVDDHEFSVNYLLRAFVERVMVLYAKHCKVHQPKMSDQRLVQVCVEALGKDGVSASDLKSMRVAMSDENASHSLHTLGAAVHTGHLPTRKSLIAAWDNWEVALRLMLDRL